MLTLAPTASSGWRKFDGGVKRNFNVHAFFNGRFPEVGYQHLKDADMANDQNRDDLLFKVDNHRFKPPDQILVGFSARKS